MKMRFVVSLVFVAVFALLSSHNVCANVVPKAGNEQQQAKLEKWIDDNSGDVSGEKDLVFYFNSLPPNSQNFINGLFLIGLEKEVNAKELFDKLCDFKDYTGGRDVRVFFPIQYFPADFYDEMQAMLLLEQPFKMYFDTFDGQECVFFKL